MTRLPGAHDHEGRPGAMPGVPLQLVPQRRPQNALAKDGRSRDLTVLTGGAVSRSRARPTEPRPQVHVLLALSVALVRAGIRSLMEGEDDIAVAGEASSGEELVQMATEARPDVVLIDINLEGLGGLAAARRILTDSRLSHTRVVMLAADEREEDVFAALQSGVSGFVVLDSEPVELLRAVRVVARGGAQLSPWATRLVLEEFASMPSPGPTHPEVFDDLTTREREIVSLVALGLTNAEIAQQLVVSPATVKTHVSRAMVKLHIRDRAKLVALAYKTGFVVQHCVLDAANGCARPVVGS